MVLPVLKISCRSFSVRVHRDSSPSNGHQGDMTTLCSLPLVRWAGILWVVSSRTPSVSVYWYTTPVKAAELHNMGTVFQILALCVGNPPIMGGFPAKRASNAELKVNDIDIASMYRLLRNLPSGRGKERQHPYDVTTIMKTSHKELSV